MSKSIRPIHEGDTVKIIPTINALISRTEAVAGLADLADKIERKAANLDEKLKAAGDSEALLAEVVALRTVVAELQGQVAEVAQREDKVGTSREEVAALVAELLPGLLGVGTTLPEEALAPFPVDSTPAAPVVSETVTLPAEAAPEVVPVAEEVTVGMTAPSADPVISEGRTFPSAEPTVTQS